MIASRRRFLFGATALAALPATQATAPVRDPAAEYAALERLLIERVIAARRAMQPAFDAWMSEALWSDGSNPGFKGGLASLVSHGISIGGVDRNGAPFWRNPNVVHYGRGV
jgi:hypothetical protein